MTDKELLTLRIKDLPDEDVVSLLIILQELHSAKIKHPKFADGSMMYAGSIVAEEVGELCRAINQFHYENGDPMEIQKEAADVGATAIRLLSVMHEETMPTKPKCDDTNYLIKVIRNTKVLEDIEIKLRSMFKIERRP